MKKPTFIPGIHLPGLSILLFGLLLMNSGCQKGNDIPDASSAISDLSTDGHGSTDNLRSFLQVNLVASNDQWGAARVDPSLVNAWGITWSSTGTAWISSQEGHVSDVYNREGLQALPAVNIPGPATDEGGNPTGTVFNPNATDFIIPAGNGTAPAAARFLFCGLDGVISAWSGTWGNHAFRKFDHSATSVYTGLALATNNGANYLYAADFRSKRIRVWDKDWNPVSMSFTDWRLPRDYAPFNIQSVGDYLYVTYAKVGRDGDEETGEGKGFVDIYRTNGIFVRRFASHGELNAPWGVAMAPAAFFPSGTGNDDRDGHGHGHDHDNNAPQPAILIGNFGDGHINVFSLNGNFRGQLGGSGHDRHALTIDGLWAISFAPTTSTIDPNRLYFAAGPKDETNGLFGYLIKDSTQVIHGHDGDHDDHDHY